MIRAYAQVAIGVVFFGLLGAVSQGCSSSSSPAGCDSTKCAADNTCIAETDPVTMKSETKCRRLCTSQTDPTSGCPFNYTCVPDATGKTYCSADTVFVTAQGPGQFGTKCNPSKGLDMNSDCDFAHGFFCNGESPVDGNAYCTQFDCTNDRDCAAGFYCGSVNRFPNVQTSAAVVANTVKVCLKREFCAPCRTDLDCLSQNNLPAHCIGDAQGNTFCAGECTTDKGCNSEAFCGAVDAVPGAKVCYPRATVCVGDGGLCAPCRSDADCMSNGVQGACVRGEYNTERSCATPAPSACFDSKGKPLASGCPKSAPDMPMAEIGCYGGVDFMEIPQNYCHGVVKFSGSITPGCFSPAR